MSEADFSASNLTEVVMSKAYAVGANFSKAQFASAVLDRVAFDGCDFRGASFYNAVRRSPEIDAEPGSVHDDAPV